MRSTLGITDLAVPLLTGIAAAPDFYGENLARAIAHRAEARPPQAARYGLARGWCQIGANSAYREVAFYSTQ